MSKDKIIFHVDVNSAFLSWTASYRISKGEPQDLRDIPSVIGHDENRGVVLAKSVPAKKYGIVTGESILTAKRKCPGLVIAPPDFKLYSSLSNKLMELLGTYTPRLEQYSIDECFMDMTGCMAADPVETAIQIKERVKTEFGFTVNVGVSSNKLLAKMASELKKPDLVHTLFLGEMGKKMWPLPVEDLFMVGRNSKKKLNDMYIYTIGDLAHFNVETLKRKFKSYGSMIWEYANGIDNSEVETREPEEKVISNSTTFPEDIRDRNAAHRILLGLSDNVSARLRKTGKCCTSVSVTVRDSRFKNYSHQRKLKNPTDSSNLIADTAKELFDEIWKGESIRLLGVALSNLEEGKYLQISLFEDIQRDEKNKALDKALDDIRSKFGDNAVVRSVFVEKKK